jgi:hypothetical protein
VGFFSLFDESCAIQTHHAGARICTLESEGQRFQPFAQAAIKEGFKGDVWELGLPFEPKEKLT